MKKVQFKPARPAPSAERWVKGHVQAGEGGAMKRLTIDIDEALHRRLKAGCATRGTKIADVVRDLIAREFSS